MTEEDIQKLQNSEAMLARLRDDVHALAIDKTMDPSIRLEQIANLTDMEGGG